MHAYLVAAAPAQLYQGNAVAASERIEALWPTIKSSQTMRLAGARIELLHVRGRAALARATLSEGRERKQWLRLAEKQASRLMKEQPPHARPWAHLLQAGIANQRGKKLEYTLYLTEAIRYFQHAGMHLYARLAQHIQGDAGALDELPIANPKRLAAALAPGLTDAPD
jgi:hypothetical protein